MIDGKSRKKAAEVARRFFAGQISNFEFENQYPASKDRAIWAIGSTFWCFYDDLREHKLKGKWAINETTKKLMGRCIVFLHSSEEYKWPEISHPGARPVEYGKISKLLNRHKRQDRFLASGDIQFWPFINEQSYLHAMQHPTLLSGR